MRANGPSPTDVNQDILVLNYRSTALPVTLTICTLACCIGAAFVGTSSGARRVLRGSLLAGGLGCAVGAGLSARGVTYTRLDPKVEVYWNDNKGHAPRVKEQRLYPTFLEIFGEKMALVLTLPLMSGQNPRFNAVGAKITEEQLIRLHSAVVADRELTNAWRDLKGFQLYGTEFSSEQGLNALGQLLRLTGPRSLELDTVTFNALDGVLVEHLAVASSLIMRKCAMPSRNNLFERLVVGDCRHLGVDGVTEEEAKIIGVGLRQRRLTYDAPLLMVELGDVSELAIRRLFDGYMNDLEPLDWQNQPPPEEGSDDQYTQLFRHHQYSQVSATCITGEVESAYLQYLVDTLEVKTYYISYGGHPASKSAPFMTISH